MLTFLHPEAVRDFLRHHNLSNVTCSLPFLEKLGGAFQKMPYENLTKLINCHTAKDNLSKIRLPEILLEEHLRFGTGGTCFSMTYFMQSILKGLGFETYPIMADRPLMPNTHCASVIVIDGKKYLLDPGFMVDRPILLSKAPIKHSLRHTDIIIGAAKAMPIPKQQRKYLLAGGFTTNQFEACTYCLATLLDGKTTIRYFLKDTPANSENFLDFWLDSFNWATLRNISITTATDNGYIYARNNFLRTTTKDGKHQTKIKKRLALTLEKTFGIDAKIIGFAFEIHAAGND